MDLSYLNARIKAWKGDLLTKEAYGILIGAEDIKSLITRLQETVYALDLEIAEARYEDEREIVEGALKGNLARTFRALWAYAPPEARVLLRPVFSIWEVYNLKAIIRAKVKGISPDDSITILMPAGDMDESALKELNQQKDVRDIVSLLSTWRSPYAEPIKEALDRYMRERHLIILELALDRFLYHYCLSAAAGNEITEWFASERIDSVNISTLFKLMGEGMPDDNAIDYFLEGGRRIDKDKFLRLAKGRDKKGLLKGLGDFIGYSRWKDIINAAEPEELFFLEEQLEELGREEICRTAITEPLSIALAICFMHSKIREIKNVRLIARAKIFAIPAMEVKRFIIT